MRIPILYYIRLLYRSVYTHLFVDTRFPASPGSHLFSSSSTSGLQPAQTSRRTGHTLLFLNPPPFHATSFFVWIHFLTACRHPHIHDLAFCILFPCNVFFFEDPSRAYIPQSSQSYSYPALKRLPPGPAPGQRHPGDTDKHVIEHTIKHRHRKIPMLERSAAGALTWPGRLQHRVFRPKAHWQID